VSDPVLELALVVIAIVVVIYIRPAVFVGWIDLFGVCKGELQVHPET
jgi:hypothetical protein